MAAAQGLGDAAAARTEFDDHAARPHLAHRQSQLAGESPAARRYRPGLPEMRGGLAEEVDGLSDGHAHPQDAVLPDWAHVEYFILNGTNPADHPPVFKRLRWE